MIVALHKKSFLFHSWPFQPPFSGSVLIPDNSQEIRQEKVGRQQMRTSTDCAYLESQNILRWILARFFQTMLQPNLDINDHKVLDVLYRMCSWFQICWFKVFLFMLWFSLFLQSYRFLSILHGGLICIAFCLSVVCLSVIRTGPKVVDNNSYLRKYWS